jgi:hypothetical protein
MFQNYETNEAVIDGFTISTSYDRESAYERGINVVNGSPTIRNNIITKNVTTDGNGCAIYVDARTYEASPIIINNDISNNECQYLWAQGVVHVLSSTASSSAQIRNNHIHDNAVGSLGTGGGISVVFTYGDGNPVIENNIIENNNADGIDVDFQNNNSKTVIIRNNTIQNNIESGINVTYFKNIQNSTSVIENNIICSNTDNGISLSAYYDSTTIQGQIRNNILTDNDNGISLAINEATSQIGSSTNPLTMTNNTITNNLKRGILFLYYNNSITSSNVNVIIANTIFSFNVVANATAIYNSSSRVTSIIPTYNDFYNNYMNCYNVSCTAGNNNISVNPVFNQLYDSETGEFDFHLQEGSQCINAGDPNSIYDNPDGKQNDMGAYGGPLADSWEVL